MYRRILLLISFVLILAIQTFAQHKFARLLGTWKLKDKMVFETWTLGKDGETLKGLSYRIQGADTVVMEKIRIFFAAGSWHYVPEVAENAAPVDFKFSKFDDNGFIAENPAHDFPKLIRYTIVRKGDSEFLDAAIEGNGEVIPYAFEKVR
jgi:hypothetical protein